MFRNRHILFFGVVFYLCYCFADDSETSDIAIKNSCQRCEPSISLYCAFRIQSSFFAPCPRFSAKFVPPNDSIDCPEVHVSCHAACGDRNATVIVSPRHGENFTVSAEKEIEFIGYCTGDDTWALKDVRTNIVYEDIIHAECQKLYENTPRYHENIDELGLTNRFLKATYKLGPISKETNVDDTLTMNSLFDMVGAFVRQC